MLAFAGLAGIDAVQLACAQDAPDTPLVRPAERETTREQRRTKKPERGQKAQASERAQQPPASARAQRAQARRAAARRRTNRPYVVGYYNPYSSYYGLRYYRPRYYGYATGGQYYQYQMPHPFAFGTSVTYGYVRPGGYQYRSAR